MKTRIISLLFVALFTLSACVTSQSPTSLSTITIQASPSGLASSATSAPQVEPADIIFQNGTIITIEKSNPTAEAVAIRGQVIQAVGSEEEIQAYKGSNTVVIDLQGGSLMPGFGDGHLHYTRNKWGEGVPVENLMDDLLSFGITSITEMHSTDEYIHAMLTAEEEGRIKLRLNIFAGHNCGFLENGKSIECPSWYRDNPPILDPGHMVRIPGVKIFLDGASGNRGCPYNSFQWPESITELWPGIWDTCAYPYGDLYLTEEQLTPVLQDIQDRGYRAAFHIMGDAAIDVALNSIQTVLHGESNLKYRHQIQHNSTLRPDQLDRYVQLNILAQVPGYFNTCEADDLVAMYGDDYYTWDVTRYALPGLGVHTYVGSDYNGRVDIHRYGNSINPALALYGLVTRRQFREDTTVCEPPEWISHYKIDIEKALEMVTIEPAYAVSMEEYIGSIKPGKFADLIILSGNPLTMNPNDLYKLSVWMTMVNGSVKYCAPGKDSYCPALKTAAAPSPSNMPSLSTSPTPSSEAFPITQVKMDCNKKGDPPVHIKSGNFVLSYIEWATKTIEQLDEYKAAVHHSVDVDGQSIPSGIDHGKVIPIEGKGLVFVRTVFDAGFLSPGTHTILTRLSFDQKVTDGFDFYGPGTQYTTIEGSCTVIIDP